MRRDHLSRIGVAVMLASALACGGNEYELPDADAPGDAGAPSASSAPTVQVDPATAATVSGSILFEGEVPKAPPINMAAEPDCAGMHDHAPPSNIVEVADGKLANVLVWIKSGLEGKTFPVRADKIVLDQVGCMYKPRMAAVQAGQNLTIKNSDPTTHNVHPLPKSNREWNRSQTAGAAPIEYAFARPEMMIPIKCNIHPWMISRLSVVEHPYFDVTEADGSFEIKNLPPGTYTLEVVHERLGNQERQITVAASAAEEMEFTFSGS